MAQASAAIAALAKILDFIGISPVIGPSALAALLAGLGSGLR